MPDGVGAISSLNAYYGQDVPLGAYKGEFGKDRWGRWVYGPYVRNLVTRLPGVVLDSSQVPEAVQVYLSVLAAADDASVTIAAVGFATNLAALLRSAEGRALVEKKVARVVWQGGWYEPLHPDGHTTFNWDCGKNSGYATNGCEGAASYAVANMPDSVEQVFSDLGDDVWHGAALSTACSDAHNPCRQAYVDMLGYGGARPSWDPLVVLFAVRGCTAGLRCHNADQGFSNRVDEDGSNHWSASNGTAPSSRQSRLAWDGERPWREAREAAGREIDALLCPD